MKLELSYSVQEVINTLTIGICLSIIVLGIGYMIYDSKRTLALAIKQSTTCEQAVLLVGGQDVSSRLIACKAQIHLNKSGQ
jgi:hypothetical protein